jgi:hypothetical protein
MIGFITVVVEANDIAGCIDFRTVLRLLRTMQRAGLAEQLTEFWR